MERIDHSNKRISLIKIGWMLLSCFLWGYALFIIAMYLLIVGLSSPVKPLFLFYAGCVCVTYLSVTLIALPFILRRREPFMYNARYILALVSLISVGFLYYIAGPLDFIICMLLLPVVVAQIVLVYCSFKPIVH